MSTGDPLAESCAHIVADGYDDYRRAFRVTTRRARARFIRQDWLGLHADVVHRFDLYAETLDRVVGEVRALLGGRTGDRKLWPDIKLVYAHRCRGLVDIELATTFFNSVSRQLFEILGTDPDVEFVGEPGEPPEDPEPPYAIYPRRGSTAEMLVDALEDTSLGAHFRDLEASSRLIAAEVEAAWGDEPIESLGLLRPVFYRTRTAYVVGRLRRGERRLPIAIALKCIDGGVVADAVLLTADEVSIVFSFTRSYFLVDLDRPRQVVRYLETIMPKKPRAELYIALGYHKHGKSELYHDLYAHLDRSTDRFENAPGDRGMVMIVFMLPSLDVVFKVIRDRFDYPKTTVREDVLDCYQLVFRHDRAGRLVDAQEFKHLEFPRDRFSPELLDELLRDARDTVHLRGDHVLIDHLYTERRVTPLNLYLRTAPEAEARAALLDYGQSIKDLAASNIFPGDLLPKNFGVTRHGRVIFYDYDELCLLTDCKFRDMPTARNPEEEAEAGAWFYVGDDDVFPEEFLPFLGLRDGQRRELVEAHGELFAPSFWRELQDKHRAGWLPPILAYPARKRLTGAGSALP